MGGMIHETVHSPYLTAGEAAAYLRLEESTLNAMRWRKEGPPFRKHGGRVVYHRDDLDGWSCARECKDIKIVTPSEDDD